jgi:hypothetical protein
VDDFDPVLRHVVRQKEFYCVIGVTMQDLYMDSTDEFCMGVASMQERIGVFSFARYSPKFFQNAMLKQHWPTDKQFIDDAKATKEKALQLLMLRAFKVCTHEVCMSSVSLGVFMLYLIHNHTTYIAWTYVWSWSLCFRSMFDARFRSSFRRLQSTSISGKFYINAY